MNKTFPLAFMLLFDKKLGTYKEMLEKLKVITSLKTIIFKIDFEIAVFNALNNVFPNFRVSFRSFHFGKLIWRKIQNLGLFCEYKNNVV